MRRYLVAILLFFCCLSGNGQGEIWMRPNKGQWNKNIAFKIDIPGGNLFLEKGGFTYAFSNVNLHYDHGHGYETEDITTISHAVKTHFIGANAHPTFETKDESDFYENYFLSNNAAQWVTNSKAYETVYYRELYDGIDLKIYQENNTLKYDILVSPGAFAHQFRVRYSGQDRLEILQDELVVSTTLGHFTERKPVAYQLIDGKKRIIPCKYRLEENEMYFDFPEGYDSTHLLIIDPELTFSTFTGATSDNWGMTACPDLDKKLIAAGIVFGAGYPLSPGPFDGTYNGGAVDIGITKFNELGTGIIFSTFIGGGGSETPHSLIVNSSNELYIMGATSSADFPVGDKPYQAVNKGGPAAIIDGINFSNGSDIFIIKLSASGNVLLGGTYLGGNDFDGISEGGTAGASMSVAYNYGDQLRGEIIVDDASNVYITSTTRSSNFPIVGGYDATLGGKQDAIVAKLNSDLSSLLWSTFVGGNQLESGNSLHLSSKGDIYVVGGTSSKDLTHTSGTIHPSYMGGKVDGYIIKFSAPTYNLPVVSYLGTSAYDQAYFVQLDKDDYVYVYGQSSGKYQTDGINYINPNSGQFIHKMNSALSATLWSSVFGAGTGVAEISPTAFLVSDCYEIYIAGWGGITNNSSMTPAYGSTTTGFPTTGDAYQSTTSGSNFYLAVFDQDMVNLKYATFMGNSKTGKDHVDGGTSRFDKSGIIYHAVCAACGPSGEFPTTPGVFSNVNASKNCNMAAFQFDLAKIEAVLSTGEPVICIPEPVHFDNDSKYGNTYFWDFGDGIGTSTEFEPTYYYTDPGDYTVMLVVSDINGCYTPDTAYIKVTIALYEGKGGTLMDTICPGSSVELYAIGGETYSWGPPEFLDDPSSSNPIATITEETTFTVIIESVCGKSEVEVTVYVYGSDANAGLDTAICAGGEASLNATGGISYSWTPPDHLDDPTISNPKASPILTTYYNVKITTKEGCLIEDIVKVKVDQDIPYPRLIDSVTICKGDSIQIIANGATDYAWLPDYYISNPAIYNPYVNPPKDTLYRVAFSNACGTIYDTVRVKVIDIKAYVSPDTTVCPGQSAYLVASGGDFYTWKPATFLSKTTTPETVSTPNNDITYTVYVSDLNGCSDKASLTVFLHEPPAITVSPAIYPIVGDTITISASGYGSILWTPPYKIACTTCPETSVYPDKEIFYTATITDEKGCTNYGIVPIYFNPLIFVPNAFTPDGDLFNNYFKAIAHNIKDFEMIIFNRWGEIVYKMESLDDSWDGTYNGSLVLDDVYVWQIVYTDLHGISNALRGHVTLIK